MDKIVISLNDFLFNSGVLGLYRVLEIAGKEDMMQKKYNQLILDKKAFFEFEEDYIKAMINTFERDTKWYSIIKRKENVRNIDIENSDEIKILDDNFKFIKKCIESASYKAGYEILKARSISEDPYNKIEEYKKTEDNNSKKKIIINIIDHIENNKETYCMKDIIYTKINCFWENVAFLNKNSNKNDIKKEYKKSFVIPVEDYIGNKRKREITCIECGNKINKKEASGMSWIKDVGVDINRKKSAFWNFNEDAYICPVCSLIYSCIPLGFTMIGPNGIFINQNNSINALISSNITTKKELDIEEENFESKYHKILYNFINRTSQFENKNMIKYEPKNIQVIKRITTKDTQRYELNIIPKDKINIWKKSIKYFEILKSSAIYQDVLTNLIQGKKQYMLIYNLLKEEKNIQYIKSILMIQAYSIEGGIKMEERKDRIEEMISEGERLQKYFWIQAENRNKLKSYVYKLQGALKSNNLEEFMKIFTLFYGSVGEPMPNCKAIKVLIEEPEYFRLLGYSYIYGLQKFLDPKEEK